MSLQIAAYCFGCCSQELNIQWICPHFFFLLQLIFQPECVSAVSICRTFTCTLPGLFDSFCPLGNKASKSKCFLCTLDFKIIQRKWIFIMLQHYAIFVLLFCILTYLLLSVLVYEYAELLSMGTSCWLVSACIASKCRNNYKFFSGIIYCKDVRAFFFFSFILFLIYFSFLSLGIV